MALKEQGKKLRRLMKVLAKGHSVRPIRADMAWLDHLILYLLQYEAPVTVAEKAFRAMQTEFVDWNELRVTRPLDLESFLDDQRVDPSLAPVLKELLQHVFDGDHCVSLDFLRDRDDEAVRRYFHRARRLPAHVGEYMLLAFLGRPQLPLDVHTERVLRRLGFIGKKFSPERVRKTVDALAPTSEAMQYHMLFLEHGKKTCTRDAPRCDRCPLAKDCDFARKASRDGRDSSSGEGGSPEGADPGTGRKGTERRGAQATPAG
ncbi:MAG: hypothetical protein HY722_13680 [Planctomycetes bacterium]|nr:hypothetical protein [Planctomycetota bacterium]